MSAILKTLVSTFVISIFVLATGFPVMAAPPPGPKDVDCTSSPDTDSLQEEVDEAEPGQTIQIHGTCEQTVVIKTANIVLDGLGAAVIDADSLPGTAVTIKAANVVLKGLTIQNAAGSGVAVLSAGSAVLQGNTIQSNGQDGILVDGNGYAFIGASSDHNTPGLQGNTVTLNGQHGIHVRQGAGADIFHNLVTSNGLGIPDGSDLRGHGINVAWGGSADIDGNTIQLNRHDGISVNSNASGQLSGDLDHGELNIVANNQRHGVSCFNEGFIAGNYGAGQQGTFESASCGRLNLNIVGP